jgi:hypothetical protein
MKKVYVLNKNGNKLMPCSPTKARHLLKAKKAKSVKRIPFTIQLLWDCEENIQEINLTIDKGSKHTGYCLIGNGEILMSGKINHRTDVSDKMKSRAANRKQRRSRLWYRESRFLNRASSRKEERIPPSIRTNVEEVLRTVNNIPLPISRSIIEDVLIDIARLNDPNLKGEDYQKSNRLDENLRLAVLLRDNFTCQYCKIKKGELHAHHIIYVSKGGKDTLSNLITLCEKCHKGVHNGQIKLEVKGVSNFKDVIAQRTMQGKSYMYKELGKRYELEKVFGYQTSEYRKKLGLPKDHDIDALCMGTLKTGEIISFHRDNYYEVNFRPVQTRRRYYDLPRKEKGRIRYQVNESIDGFEKGDIVEVKGYIKQINSIYSNGNVAFKRVKGEPSAIKTKDCRLLEKRSSVVFSTIRF